MMGYVVTAMLAFALGGILVAISRGRRDSAPRVGGTQVRVLTDGIDLSRSYDFVCSGEYSATWTYRIENGRIVGFVGETRDSAGMFGRGQWLVVELADLRRVYVHPHHIQVLEEAKLMAPNSAA